MKNIIVIGGGASGMMAAIAASANGAKVTIIEQNPFPGKKNTFHRKRPLQLYQFCSEPILLPFR